MLLLLLDLIMKSEIKNMKYGKKGLRKEKREKKYVEEGIKRK